MDRGIRFGAANWCIIVDVYRLMPITDNSIDSMNCELVKTLSIHNTGSYSACCQYRDILFLNCYDV